MKTNARERFDENYYQSYCGDLPYLRSTREWHDFFNPIADAIVLGLAPKKVFDAGCAVGFLVEKLWDRGVEVHGRDISDFAIAQVRQDVRPWCKIGSIADPIEGRYDLALCLEVLEYMAPEEALAAIAGMAAAAPRILFSSSPAGIEEETRINVRPPRYWLDRFAEAGFAPVVSFDATFLCPHAILFERSETGRDERSLAAFAEIVHQRLKVAESRDAEKRLRRECLRGEADLRNALIEKDDAIRAHEATLDTVRRVQDAIRRHEGQLRAYADVEGTLRTEIARLTIALQRKKEKRLSARLKRAPKFIWWAVTFRLKRKLRKQRLREEIRVQASSVPSAPSGTPSARAMLNAHCTSWLPLPVFMDRRASPTVTVLTDSIGSDRLFGGVGTALVLGVFLARRRNARLRIVTRHAPPDAGALANVLEAHKIAWEGATDLVHLPLQDSRFLAIGPEDLLVTTSWWTTRAALGSVDSSQVLYLLQEDERMFYPYGDSRLRCAEVLAERDLRILVNTRLLFDHLRKGPDPIPGLEQRGDWFEPAFPAFPRSMKPQSRPTKRNFFFYARPHNDRNLYWRGLEAVESAIRSGILSPDEWTFYFVGHDLPDMLLHGNVQPVVRARMPWLEYAGLVAKMDLGLCLMDTPHPSYPPLDLAAAGAVVVTNTHGPKTSAQLERWSRNIIPATTDIASLTAALREGAARSSDIEVRAANCAADGIARDWEETLGTVLDRMFPQTAAAIPTIGRRYSVG